MFSNKRSAIILCALFCATIAFAEKIHELLGLPEDADANRVKGAYRKAALKYHPDKTKDPAKRALFTEISREYDRYRNKGNGEEITGPAARPGMHKRRSKREVATYMVIAAVQGIVGVTVENLLNDHQPAYFEATTGVCYWEGRSPLCLGSKCMDGFDEIRRIQGWKNKPKSFGAPCLSPAGGKLFCCKPALGDTSWGGSWQDAMTGNIYHCSYWPIGTCGEMQCLKDDGEEFDVEIGGEISGKCNEVGVPVKGGKKLRGKWAAGVIQFDVGHHRWYKIR